ncbi:hypothetical protein PHMEG_00011580 [Phytophthora megakarya]|uniref:Uncharacterized protein n=1 Tax=Phytophthora megakarya TaxID=4795 RepID=A0A225WCL3_9STRA|nr:hypothetical protein PHMEG_00011580 [Phytophthora megakarya]
MVANRDLCAFFETQGNALHRCKLCGADRKQLPGTGYSNLVSYLASHHEDFRAQYDARHRGPERTRAMFKWRPTNSTALKSDMIAVAVKVGGVIRSEMGERFGLMFDGCSHGTMHFVGVFALYVVDGHLKRTLLSLSPLDDGSQDNDAHIAMLSNVLTVYNKATRMLLFIVSDNCNTNRSIATKLGIPLLRQPNNAAELFKLTPLRAKKHNATRWSSAYDMPQRYAELLAHARLIEDVEDTLPSSNDHKKLLEVLGDLRTMESVCKRLQCEATNMSDVRLLFESIVADYPIMVEYRKPNSRIVYSSAFESGVVKVFSDARLTPGEAAPLKRFELLHEKDAQSAATGKEKKCADDYASQIVRQGGN